MTAVEKHGIVRGTTELSQPKNYLGVLKMEVRKCISLEEEIMPLFPQKQKSVDLLKVNRDKV